MAFFFTMLCTRFVPAGGSGATAILGILVGLVYAGPHLISFAVQPLTTKILCGWIAGDGDLIRVLQAQSSARFTNSSRTPLAVHDFEL